MPARDADLLVRAVRIPSVIGREAEAVHFMQDQARADGFRVREDEAGNFIAETGDGDRTLLFVGHIDTVPGDIPVRVDDGVLWGRGSVDAKGSLVAAYCAARRHLDDPDLRIIVVGAVDEEGASRGARALEVERAPEWIINGEPSGADGLTIGYKGIVRGSFSASTPAMHGAHPGANAADRVVDWWTDVRHQLGAAEGFDAVQARLDAFTTTDGPDRMHAQGRFQLRLPPASEPDAVIGALRQAAMPGGVEVQVEEAVPAAVASRRNALVAAFTSVIRGRGERPRLQRKTGTSDFNILRRRYPEVPIVAYGPGDASLDHTPHERIALDEFAAGVATLDAVMQRLATVGDEGAASRVAVPQAVEPTAARAGGRGV